MPFTNHTIAGIVEADGTSLRAKVAALTARGETTPADWWYLACGVSSHLADTDGLLQRIGDNLDADTVIDALGTEDDDEARRWLPYVSITAEQFDRAWSEHRTLDSNLPLIAAASRSGLTWLNAADKRWHVSTDETRTKRLISICKHDIEDDPTLRVVARGVAATSTADTEQSFDELIVALEHGRARAAYTLVEALRQTGVTTAGGASRTEVRRAATAIARAYTPTWLAPTTAERVAEAVLPHIGAADRAKLLDQVTSAADICGVLHAGVTADETQRLVDRLIDLATADGPFGLGATELVLERATGRQLDRFISTVGETHLLGLLETETSLANLNAEQFDDLLRRVTTATFPAGHANRPTRTTYGLLAEHIADIADDDLRTQTFVHALSSGHLTYTDVAALAGKVPPAEVSYLNNAVSIEAAAKGIVTASAHSVRAYELIEWVEQTRPDRAHLATLAAAVDEHSAAYLASAWLTRQGTEADLAELHEGTHELQDLLESGWSEITGLAVTGTLIERCTDEQLEDLLDREPHHWPLDALDALFVRRPDLAGGAGGADALQALITADR